MSIGERRWTRSVNSARTGTAPPVAGQGTIRVHSQQERRYRCTVCGRTFAATRGTPFYRAHSPLGLLIVVLILLSYGCPVQAIVAA